MFGEAGGVGSWRGTSFDLYTSSRSVLTHFCTSLTDIHISICLARFSFSAGGFVFGATLARLVMLSPLHVQRVLEMSSVSACSAISTTLPLEEVILRTKTVKISSCEKTRMEPAYDEEDNICDDCFAVPWEDFGAPNNSAHESHLCPGSTPCLKGTFGRVTQLAESVASCESCWRIMVMKAQLLYDNYVADGIERNRSERHRSMGAINDSIAL